MADQATPDHRYLLAVHPSTATTPRGIFALYDPSASQLPAPWDIACWITTCECGQQYPARPATWDEITALFTSTRHDPATPTPAAPTGQTRNTLHAEHAGLAGAVGSQGPVGPMGEGYR